ncbi:MAG: phosphoadenylyl-sulfate reductase [Spirochaetaceae bacterium]
MAEDSLLKEYQDKLLGSSAWESLNWVFNNFDLENIAFATSLGAEDQVLTDLILNINSGVDIFTLDTGRLFEATYKVIQNVKDKYGKNMELLFPESSSIKKLVEDKGPNLFYNSVADRKECCRVRKIEPLKKKLSGKKIWITGLRKDQSITRTDLNILDWDESFGLLKLSPLLSWSEKDVWDYIKENNIPHNSLHEIGFPSIGCEPCTRAIKTGEDVRSGRWWWENPEHKECGLHKKDGKSVPRRTEWII